jgi:hypothetical protein
MHLPAFVNVIIGSNLMPDSRHPIGPLLRLPVSLLLIGHIVLKNVIPTEGAQVRTNSIKVKIFFENCVFLF